MSLTDADAKKALRLGAVTAFVQAIASVSFFLFLHKSGDPYFADYTTPFAFVDFAPIALCGIAMLRNWIWGPFLAIIIVISGVYFAWTDRESTSGLVFAFALILIYSRAAEAAIILSHSNRSSGNDRPN